MKKIDLSKFAPLGTKHCEAQCDRVPVKTRNGVKIVCLFCKRIVMERKN
jgi:hypothetical protein